MDTKTVNDIIALLEAKIAKYAPDSEGSIALEEFKEELSNL